jgi:hypothetical protein
MKRNPVEGVSMANLKIVERRRLLEKHWGEKQENACNQLSIFVELQHK